MPGHDLILLTEAARDAGEIARKYFRDGARAWDKPDGAGPVTEADLAVNDRLEAILRGARPDYGWLSEETTDGADRLASDTVFIIDPIDGTRSFVEGSHTWALSIAVVTCGSPVAGVVFLPERDMLFAADLNSAATLNGTSISVSTADRVEGADILATKPSMDPSHWTDGSVPAFTRHHRPSLAYRLALVAQGRFDAMMTLRPCWEWDIAAGAIIAAQAGARVTNKSGQALQFNRAEPLLDGVLTAGSAMHTNLLEHLRSA